MATNTQVLDPKSLGLDWTVTQAKADEAVRRIVEIARPLRVVAFGSWARGQIGAGSDLDLAVILAGEPDGRVTQNLYLAMHGIGMSVDIITASLARHQRFSKSVNSVHYDIANEGIILYEEEADGSASGTAAA